MAVSEPSWGVGTRGFVINSMRNRVAPAVIVSETPGVAVVVFNEVKQEEQEFDWDSGFARGGSYWRWQEEQAARPQFVREDDEEARQIDAAMDRRDLMVSNFDNVVEKAKEFKDTDTAEAYDALNDAVIEWGQDAGIIAE